MNQEQREFLRLQRLPAVISALECTWITGFNEQEISILVAAGILLPLGAPDSTEKRVFASLAVERFCQDLEQLKRARAAIRAYS